MISAEQLEKRVGESYGCWEVIESINYEKVIAKCLNCGKTKEVWYRHLKRGNSASCGCLPKSIHRAKLTDKSFLKDTYYQYLVEVDNFLKLNHIAYTVNQEVHGVHLDFVITNKNIAISFHRTLDNFVKHGDKKYYFNETKIASENGIRIIHIFEHEWLDVTVHNKLLAFLKDTLCKVNTLYARLTKCRQIDGKEARDFINKYHLQGYAPARISYGLYYKNELIAVSTFSKSRFDHDIDYEIIRLVYKYEYNVLGGTGKMLVHFINDFNVHHMVSYSDISKFTGKSYIKSGMQFTGFSDPGYVWVKDSEVISRQRVQKHKLLAMGWGEEWQTENDIMIMHGYNKVYNCGNARFIYYKE